MNADKGTEMEDLNTRLSRLEGKYETDMGWLKEQAEDINNKTDDIRAMLLEMKGEQDEKRGRDRVVTWGGAALLSGIVSWIGRHIS